MLLSQEQLVAVRTAVTTAMEARPAATVAELVVVAAVAAVAMGQPAAADINSISHTIPNFWPEDTDGFFPVFEAACVNTNITQDGTKYSKLLSVLTPAAQPGWLATSQSRGLLPDPTTH